MLVVVTLFLCTDGGHPLPKFEDAIKGPTNFKIMSRRLKHKEAKHGITHIISNLQFM
jgi:hypothetical protein